MRILDELAANLKRSGDNSVAAVRWANKDNLERQHAKLAEWLGGGAGLSKPSVDRVLLALETFYGTNELESMAQARLVSYGCTQRITETQCLIEDPRRLGVLLGYVDSHREYVRPFRKCYRGLLHSYFSYDPEGQTAAEAGKQNWYDLRSFLLKRLREIATGGTDPDWVASLTRHVNLLEDDPCGRYGTVALKGDRAAFEEIRAQLHIQDDSWVVRSMIDAQIDSAVRLNDDEFKVVLRYVLPLLAEHPLLIDRGLGRVLNRYVRCRSLEVDIRLRDFAVLQWKNPWLSSNAARWGSVDPKARDMVAGWLKLQLITQFFSLLAEDGSNDTRRVDFWKGYHDQIQDMYFALGPSALYNRSKDFQEIRKAMDGRLMQLLKSGQPTNNAFIMMIGDYVVVEFGTTGNAAYVFKGLDRLPFKLHGTVSGDAFGLKNAQCSVFVDRLIHRDTNEGSWEDRFASVLRSRVGNRSGPGASRYFEHSAEPIHDKPDARQSVEKILQAFAKQHDLSITDNRAKGGVIWVSPRKSLTTDAKLRLENLGFRWSERRRAYYKID